MTSVVVVADTHMPVFSNKYPKALIKALKSADLCIHAGDITESDIYNYLASLCSIEAVAGNMDCLELKNSLPQNRLINIKGVKIFVTHGSGTPHDILERVHRQAKPLDPDIVVFGHTHKKFCEDYKGFRFLNPGSVTDPYGTSGKSYALITIDKNDYEINFFDLEDR